jgi:pyruvate formate lyase activating enzyme
MVHSGEVETRLDRFAVARSELAVAHPSGKLVCVACAHRCKLADGGRGVCLVRARRGDALTVPWGYTAGVAVDPIEKKPFFHFLPGARALSFGMLGCDMHCAYCQNWFTSQTLRDSEAEATAHPTSPEALVNAAREHGCAVVTSTYNEPLITAEWAHDVFSLAQAAGLRTTFVSNGHATPEALDYLAPVLDACKVDLKSLDRKTYLTLGGKLESVLETIRSLVGRGIWTEVVTLVVPELNDSDAELTATAEFLAGVSPDLPWHVTAFHPDYRLTGPPPTPAGTLLRAAAIGERAGLRFVYAGNLPGHTGTLEDTRCPDCGATVVRRVGFLVRENRMAPTGACPDCGAHLPGLWAAGAALQPARPAKGGGPPLR